MNEDILDAAISVLKAKVDVIMYDVNSILSSSMSCYENKAANKLASKISELAIANQNYQQALSLKMQMLTMKVKNLPQSEDDQQKSQNNQSDGNTA